MTTDNEHKRSMAEVKAKVTSAVKQANLDKGLILVLTGDGKGKSSSGLGMALRAFGHGMKIGVVQFIKGLWDTGEKKFFERFPEIEYFALGQGFTWDTQDKEGDIKRAKQVWDKALEMIKNPDIDLVLLDEINVVLDFGYLSLSEVIQALKNKPDRTHVILTGRNAPEEIIDLADTVSNISVIKHAFDSGIRAQKGIEF